MKTCIQTLSIMALAASLSYGEDTAKPERKRPDPEKMFKRLDSDSNGSISLAEFKASPRAQRNPEKAGRIFKKIDADSNGEATLDEFKAHRPKHHRRAGGKGPKRPDAPKAE